MAVPSKDIEFEIQTLLIQEYSMVMDADQNDAVFMRDFTFFDHCNDYILNSYRYNVNLFTSGSRRIDRFSISFFDYAEWYNSARSYIRGIIYNTSASSKWSNNPSNYTRYYCSKSTGPAWKKCREVAAGSVGASYSKQIGPSLCKVEKISDHMLRYSESDNGLIVPLNNGEGCLYWEFDYEKV